jgi:hypothetical protein
MTGWDNERAQLLTASTGDLARIALANVVREYPHHESHWHTEGEPIPTPRQLHPCFYGSVDWHSCVEMFWVLVRLLRHHAELVPAAEIRHTLSEHLTVQALAAEAASFAPREHRITQRPTAGRRYWNSPSRPPRGTTRMPRAGQQPCVN